MVMASCRVRVGISNVGLIGVMELELLGLGTIVGLELMFWGTMEARPWLEVRLSGISSVCCVVSGFRRIRCPTSLFSKNKFLQSRMISSMFCLLHLLCALLLINSLVDFSTYGHVSLDRFCLASISFLISKSCKNSSSFRVICDVNMDKLSLAVSSVISVRTFQLEFELQLVLSSYS